MKRGKKGAIEMEYIVIVVVLVITFIALAYALIRLDIIGLGEDAACKLSILAKTTAPTWLPNVAPSLPIECVTNKICLGGECKVNFEGEKNVKEIELSAKDAEAKKKIEKTVADSFYKCWDDFGRGKMDIFGSLSESIIATENAKPRCVICSRIALDKNAKPSVVSQVNVREYMINNNPKGSDFNYFKTLDLGSGSKLDARTVQASMLGQSEYNPKKSDEVAVVFMQISAPSKNKAGLSLVGGTTAGAGSVAFVGSRLVTGSGLSVFKPIIKNPFTALGALLIGEALYGSAEVSSSLSRGDAAAYCGTYTNNNQKSTGCSVVQILPYDRSSINSICEVIEGEA